jgi:hypothetical protein
VMDHVFEYVTNEGAGDLRDVGLGYYRKDFRMTMPGNLYPPVSSPAADTPPQNAYM